jgi:Rod binding domain-containing protein
MEIAALSPTPARAPAHQRADDAAKEFEAQMLAQMLAPLFNSVSTPEIAGGGDSERYFSTMLQEHYAKAMTARGGIGIADAVRAALIDIQSGQAGQSEGARR